LSVSLYVSALGIFRSNVHVHFVSQCCAGLDSKTVFAWIMDRDMIDLECNTDVVRCPWACPWSVIGNSVKGCSFPCAPETHLPNLPKDSHCEMFVLYISSIAFGYKLIGRFKILFDVRIDAGSQPKDRFQQSWAKKFKVQSTQHVCRFADHHARSCTGRATITASYIASCGVAGASRTTALRFATYVFRTVSLFGKS
jgi:hypothetical protein